MATSAAVAAHKARLITLLCHHSPDFKFEVAVLGIDAVMEKYTVHELNGLLETWSPDIWEITQPYKRQGPQPRKVKW